MRAVRRKDQVVLTCNFLEVSIFRRALTEIAEYYKLTPREMNPKLAECWYSTRGCKSAKMSPQETQDWLNTLHEYKSANLQHVNRWIEVLAHREVGSYQLVLSLEEAACLITVANDHRLLMATLHNIGQEEMDARSMQDVEKLKMGQQTAIFCIHFLAGIVEELICLIDPDAGSWKESAIDML
jgi:hypothetical protein